MGMPATEIDVEIGERLRSFRVAKGLSLHIVGEAVGLTYQQVQKYEKGMNWCSASMLCRLAKAMEVDLAMLFPPSVIQLPGPKLILIAEQVGHLPDHVREPLVELIETVLKRSASDR